MREIHTVVDYRDSNKPVHGPFESRRLAEEFAVELIKNPPRMPGGYGAVMIEEADNAGD